MKHELENLAARWRDEASQTSASECATALEKVILSPEDNGTALHLGILSGIALTAPLDEEKREMLHKAVEFLSSALGVKLPEGWHEL